MPQFVHAGALFESIFRYAECPNEADPVWGWSDTVGLTTAKSGCWASILRLLPEWLRPAATEARHFAVRDISVD